MYFDIFKEYTLEEQLKIERYRQLTGELADMKNEAAELQYELSCIQNNKKMDYIPLVICSVCIVPVIALFILDLIAGAVVKGSGLAIALASGLPVLFVIFAIGIILSARQLNFKYSKNPSVQEKAKAHGIVNVPARSAAVIGRLDQIRKKTLELQNEQKEIECFMEKSQE